MSVELKIDMAATRELLEETQIEASLDFFHTLYIKKPGYEYAYHLFQGTFEKRPEVRLSNEHSDYRWVRACDLAQFDLISVGKEALDLHLKRKQAGTR